MPLLEVTDLKTWYPVKGAWFQPKQFVRAVDGVSLFLEAGETIGLVGESGCGKSSLGRTIIRLEDAHAGKVLVNGQNLLEASGSELRNMRKKIQMIFQDPYASLNPRMTVFKMIDEVLNLHTPLKQQQRADRIAELLDMVGLKTEHMPRYPHQFSGGQRQRVGIARALAVEPQLIIADEPVSALDVSVQAQIINLLAEIQEKTGISYLFIAHDLAVVEHVSKRIMVMYLGKIVEDGEGEEVCKNPKHPYTRALLSAVPTLDSETRRHRIILPGDVPSPLNPPPGCPFHPRCPIVQEKCRKEMPQLVNLGSNHCSACHFPEKVSGSTLR